MHRASFWVCAGCLLTVSVLCHATDAGSGLVPGRDAARWSGLQGRVSLSANTDRHAGSSFDTITPKVLAFGVFGDYYFARSRLGQGVAGGFRATSGVLLGATSPFWATSALGISGYSGVSRRGNGSLSTLSAGEAETSTLSYLGLGYSGLSLKGGWGFAADLGVMAVQSGTAVRLGRTYSSAPGSDELVRELRLSPVLQLGVSYTF